jgi:hypothetical protein
VSVESHRVKASDRPLDELGVLANESQRTERERLEKGIRPQKRERFVLDTLPISQGGEGIEPRRLARHLGEVHRLAQLGEEPLDPVQLAAKEREAYSRRFVRESVAFDSKGVGLGLEASGLGLVPCIGARDRADEQGADVELARGGGVVGNRPLCLGRQPAHNFPVRLELLDHQMHADPVDGVV